MRASRVIAFVVILAAVPLTVLLGAVMDKRAYMLVSIAVIVLAMVPFFASFERRRPKARELVTLAVMIAIAVASRAVFAFVPHFKPMAAIIMMCGIAFGAPSGFLAGSLAAFVSNFIFGQGPWTPFQMLSFGLCGYAFGLLADFGAIARSGWGWRQRLLVSIGAGLFIVVVAGPILDTSGIVWILSSVTPEGVASVYLAGLPVNVIHGIATAVTMALVGNAILGELARLRTKYGMMS